MTSALHNVILRSHAEMLKKQFNDIYLLAIAKRYLL